MEYEISVAEVKSMRDAEQEIILLDVREPWEIDVARISGSQTHSDGRHSSALQPGA